MLKWCSYCQTFQGEVEPYDHLEISHGICPACRRGALEIGERDLEHAQFLRGIQSRLMAAGRDGDIAAADEIVRAAASAGCRPIDTLVGLVAPLLFQIGEEWKRSVITVADEHRFTSFCEGLYGLVAARTTCAVSAGSAQTEVLMMNAAGNRHTLGLRFLALWLAGEDLSAREVVPGSGLGTLASLIDLARPRVLAVSMALAEQRQSVVDIVASVAELPRRQRPRILVGGYAVKMAMVSPIPGAELTPNLRSIVAAVRG